MTKCILSSLFDKRTKRELCENGQTLNTFLLAEDVPLAWDNWDIDADIEYKLRDTATLLERSGLFPVVQSNTAFEIAIS